MWFRKRSYVPKAGTCRQIMSGRNWLIMWETKRNTDVATIQAILPRHCALRVIGIPAVILVILEIHLQPIMPLVSQHIQQAFSAITLPNIAVIRIRPDFGPPRHTITKTIITARCIMIHKR